MKVLHVEAGKHLYGGARQVLYIAEGMAQCGHDSVVVCPTASAIGKAARESGLRVIETCMAGDADIGLVWRLKRIFRAEQPDIVHLHSRRGADVFGGLAAKTAGIPCVLSRRVDNPESRWWTGLKYGMFDHVITISEGIRAVLLSQGLQASDVSCVRSSVVAREYQQAAEREVFLKEFNLASDAIVIGVVAQLIERKGHRFLLQLMPGLLKKWPNLRVVLFGKGPQREQLQQQINELGLESSVQFAGFREDMPRWLGNLDLLVHPALMEGLGISLLQASAAGVPIIAARAGGIPEAIDDGKTGILIEPGNVEELQKALEKLLADSELRKVMGAAGASWIEHAFSVDAMVEGNLNVYRNVLSV